MSDYAFEARAKALQEIQSASLLDGISIFLEFNKRRGVWADIPAAIEREEAFPGVTQEAFDAALARTRRMEAGAHQVALAFYEYPEAEGEYEQVRTAWLAENPGFSEQTYSRALHSHLIALR